MFSTQSGSWAGLRVAGHGSLEREANQDSTEDRLCPRGNGVERRPLSSQIRESLSYFIFIFTEFQVFGRLEATGSC